VQRLYYLVQCEMRCSSIDWQEDVDQVFLVAFIYDFLVSLEGKGVSRPGKGVS